MQYRKNILDLLKHKRHARVEEIFKVLKKHSQSLSMATVYRNIKALEQKGEVIGFLHPDGAIRYELPAQEEHQHLVCENCGVIVEIRFGFVKELSQNIEKRTNFFLHTRKLSMIGRCKRCR